MDKRCEAPRRVALIGLGRVSKKHLDAIRENKEKVEIGALCDISTEKRDIALGYIARHSVINNDDIRLYAEYEDLISDISQKKLKIDLIVLMTPSGLHAAQAIKAARAGVNVCTEKPMATKWKDGVEMVRECEKAGVNLFVVKQNRFNGTLRLLKRQIDEGRFGSIAVVSVNVFWQRPQDYYDQDEWRGTWELDGGALMNQASHYIDLLVWLIGPVERIGTYTATVARNIEVEDSAVLIVKWRSGTLGTMAVTMVTYPENMEGSITIVGDRGTVRIGGEALNRIEYWRFDTTSNDDESASEVSYEIDGVYGFGHAAYYKNMINALNGVEEPVCDGREGLKSLELLAWAYKSANRSEIITLPAEVDMS